MLLICASPIVPTWASFPSKANWRCSYTGNTSAFSGQDSETEFFLLVAQRSHVTLVFCTLSAARRSEMNEQAGKILPPVKDFTQVVFYILSAVYNAKFFCILFLYSNSFKFFICLCGGKRKDIVLIKVESEM